MIPVSSVTPYTSFIGFLIGLPTLAATYYQAWKSRQESRETRQELRFNGHCLEFVLRDGTSVNLIPLSTLTTLPLPGDIVLLPGSTESEADSMPHGAYRIGRLEHIYTRTEGRRARSGQARLAKVVAHVESVSDASRPLSVHAARN